MKPIVRQLEEVYGGKWEYMPFYGWKCEELDMFAHYTSSGYDVLGNPIKSLFNNPKVYGNGKRGETFFVNR